MILGLETTTLLIILGTLATALGLATIAYYLRTTDETVRSSGAAVSARVTSRRAKIAYASVLVALASLGILWLCWTYLGAFNTIIYLFLFLFTLTFLPAYIGILGDAAPGNVPISKLHCILGAMAFWRTILVQHDDRWELCPATKNQVYVNGEWHDIEGGHENWSMLGWRPFAITRFKTDETLKHERVDVKAERLRGAATDGGTVERGGVGGAAPPPVSGVDGEWLIDLKRVFSRGIMKMGDIELIETAEEITARNHASSGITSGRETLIGTIVGLVLGIGTAYAMYGGV